MKTIDGEITLLFNDNGMTIEIHDQAANVTFAKVNLNNKQALQVMSRLARTDCEIKVFGLDKVGKQVESKPFEFELPRKRYQMSELEVANIAKELLKDSSWIPSTYFGSKDSFFDRDGKPYARTHMKRWVGKKC